MTEYLEPTPDLFDICVVLNEACDAPLGTNLLPYAERCKRIVIESLAEEADRKSKLYGGGIDYLTNNTCWTMTAHWLRRMVQP